MLHCYNVTHRALTDITLMKSSCMAGTCSFLFGFPKMALGVNSPPALGAAATPGVSSGKDTGIATHRDEATTIAARTSPRRAQPMAEDSRRTVTC